MTVKTVAKPPRLIRLGGAKQLTRSPDGGEEKEINPLLSYNP